MASLTAHLRRPSDHGRLPFHPECPICCRDRLSGPLPADAVVGRRTQALLAAGVLALSTATPTAVLAAEPDQEQEGAAAPDEAATQLAPGAPVYDPGGDSTDVPFDASAVPDPEAEQDPAADALEQDAATREGTAVADSGDSSGSQAPGELPGAPAHDVPSVPPATEPMQQASPPAPEAPTAERQATTSPVVTQDWRQRDDEARTAKPQSNSPRTHPAPANSPPQAAPAGGVPAPSAPSTALVAHAASPATHKAAHHGDKVHLVASGESLWSIAGDLLGDGASAAEIAREVNRLWQLNSNRIGTGDPSLLMVGTRLALR